MQAYAILFAIFFAFQPMCCKSAANVILFFPVNVSISTWGQFVPRNEPNSGSRKVQQKNDICNSKNAWRMDFPPGDHPKIGFS